MINSQASFPSYLSIAYSYIGTKEYKGKGTNPKLAELFKGSGTGVKDDDIPWCAAFIGAVFVRAGLPVPKAFDASLNWRTYGVKSVKPVVGAIVIFHRKPSGGHIGLIVKISDCGNFVYVLGGNQNDEVNIRKFDLRERQAYFRIPLGVKLNPNIKEYRPINVSNIQKSTKEV